MKRKKVNDNIFDFDLGKIVLPDLEVETSYKEPARNPSKEKEEMQKHGFSESEINAYIEGGGKLIDYFITLFTKYPDEITHVKDGFVVNWYDVSYGVDEDRKIPTFIKFNSTELVSMKEGVEETG